ncbi:hypothetical protein ACIRBX_35500 [Kitasatospora sp. NPDC096147]|uniref:hypothetical protein n=1 Tax=Kitasatospora sp. NPDC096147 TaxID=3364093 RepID=UPI003806F5FD
MAATGALLASLWLLFAAQVGRGMAGFVWIFFGGAALAVGYAVLSWRALHRLDLRPAWRVAVPAPVLAWAGLDTINRLAPPPAAWFALLFLLGATAYALPAAIALPGRQGPAVRGALATATTLLLLWWVVV